MTVTLALAKTGYLLPPDLNKDFVFQTDVSDYGLGNVFVAGARW